MIVEIAAVIAALAAFGLFLIVIAVAVVTGQNENREETRRLTDEFDRIVERLGEEEGGGHR
jgi:hypothetical protein